jgi:putative transposase
METQRSEHSLMMMCRALEVSRSGYYKWQKRAHNNRHQHRATVKSLVIETYYQFKRRYGAPRITRELNEIGIACSHNHVAALLREAGLKARNGKGFRYSKSNSGQYNVSNNLLKRDFSATRPNEKWVTDITHILSHGGWLYLSVFMDLYSRAIVGWAVDKHMTESLINDALDMALSRRDVQAGLIIHSDQGVQYRTHCYQEKLRSLGCKISMSRRGDCYDNAAMESFFSRLKVELIFAEKFTTLEQARKELFQYIEIFYNRQRRHSANGDVSPMQYESQFNN